MSTSPPKVSDLKENEEFSVKGKEEANNSETPDSWATSLDDGEESLAVPKSGKSVKCRKNDVCVQQALRSLNRLSSPEEKFTAICAKYADIFDENRKLQATSKENQKQLTAVTKEKDQTRADLMKALFTKDKLENLCRELQRQNREIREESLQKIRDEEQKRKEVSTKFQTTLNEITELMKQDSDKTMKLRDDNIDMTSKLKSIYEQYEIREQQIEKMAKQMALESQLYEAKIAKLEMETAAEKEVLLREKQQLLLTLTEYQARFQEYQNIEVTLRNQVALYNNKYEEFEKSLTRSNEVFGGFKSEMENMSNKIVKLESETAAWKLRWEKTQKALIEMASEKQKSDQEIVLAAKQMATLHKLCRTLQSERTQLLARLKNGPPQNEVTENSSNFSDDVKNLLESKIINDDNAELARNNAADGKNMNSKSKTPTKFSQQVNGKSSNVPKTKSKTDKKSAYSKQNDGRDEVVVKFNDSKLDIAQIIVDETPNKQAPNVDCAVDTLRASLSSSHISLDEILVCNEKITTNSDGKLEQTLPQSNSSILVGDVKSVSESETKSPNKNAKSTTESVYDRNMDISASIAFQDFSVPATEIVKVESLAADVSNHLESIHNNSVNNNKKKALQKKKNKK